MITIQYAGCHQTEENYKRIRRQGGSGTFLLIFFESAMYVVTEEGIENASPSACILYAPGAPQDYGAVRDFRASFVHFTADEEEIARFKIPQNRVFYPGDPASVLQLLGRIDNEFYAQDLYAEEALSGLVQELLIRLSRDQYARKIEENTSFVIPNPLTQERLEEILLEYGLLDA